MNGKGRSLTLLGVACILAATLWLGFPFLRAFVLDYRFDQNVRVRIDLPRCSKVISQKVTCCLCVVAFEGTRSPSDIQLAGSQLVSKYDERDHSYQVSGSGTITDGRNTIELREGRILLNGRDVPDSIIPMRALFTKSG